MSAEWGVCALWRCLLFTHLHLRSALWGVPHEPQQLPCPLVLDSVWAVGVGSLWMLEFWENSMGWTSCGESAGICIPWWCPPRAPAADEALGGRVSEVPVLGCPVLTQWPLHSGRAGAEGRLRDWECPCVLESEGFPGTSGGEGRVDSFTPLKPTAPVAICGPQGT